VPQIILKREKRLMAIFVGGIAAVVVVVLLACLGLLLLWQSQRNVLMQAQTLDKQGKYAEEEVILSNYLAKHPLKLFQEPVLVQLGDVTYKRLEFSQSYKWYLMADADAGKPALDLKLKLAQAAAASGNYLSAASYYQQVINLTPKDPAATYDERISPYQDQMRFMEGKR
jgi:hypothetical protein